MQDAGKSCPSQKAAAGRRLSPAAVFGIKIALTAAAVVLLFTFVFGFIRVSGNAMYPSARDGDVCLLFKLEPYHVGDVVAYQDENGKTRLGRIVVMQGEFDIKDNRPLLNGAQLSEEVQYETPKGSYSLPCRIEQGEYWIMNDFRSNTDDSRNIGPVKENNLKGKVMFLFRRRGF